MGNTSWRATLIQKIQMVFNGVPQPEMRRLFVAEAMDSYTMPAQSDFVGRWQDVPDIHLEACPHALAYLDATGIQFYLPAFLCWCLRLPDNRRPMAFHHTLYALDPCTEQQQMHEHFLERFAGMHHQQLAVIAEFVQICANKQLADADEIAASRYLDQYWHASLAN